MFSQTWAFSSDNLVQVLLVMVHGVLTVGCDII